MVSSSTVVERRWSKHTELLVAVGSPGVDGVLDLGLVGHDAERFVLVALTGDVGVVAGDFVLVGRHVYGLI